MKGLERVYGIDIVVDGKDISGKTAGFDYPVGGVEVSKDRIFVRLEVRDFVKFGKKIIFYDDPIEKIIIEDDEKPEYRDKSRDIEGDDLNRVYCYDYEGNMLWQMQAPGFENLSDTKQYPIIEMEYDRKKNKLFVTDIMGQKFEVNVETGEPTKLADERISYRNGRFTMKGVEGFNREELIISGKKIKFDYFIGRLEICETKIFVCLNVGDIVKFGKQCIFFRGKLKKILINNETKPECRDTNKDIKGDDLHRVYCYDYEGNLVWQMKSPIHLLPKREKSRKNGPTRGELFFEECQIEWIKYDRKKKKFFAIDSISRYFDINLETGEPMSFEAIR
ncbi:MAG: hypothetical protein LBB44_01690 [Endomicrobium sp.]|jgi:hypothetical protein|nr:hypothetical protein [Endomicrobium sp.]